MILSPTVFVALEEVPRRKVAIISPLKIYPNKNTYQNGLICLKGGNIEEESVGVNYPVIDYSINEFFNEPFFETKKIVYVPM